MMEAEKDPMFSAEKDAEARLEAERAAVSASQLPPGMVAPPAVPPGMVATVVPTLPPQLWPHSYIYLSVAAAISLGILSFLTLSFTIPAIILSGRIYYENKKANYVSAKGMSKIVLALLMSAIIMFCVFWFSGWITFLGLYIAIVYYT